MPVFPITLPIIPRPIRRRIRPFPYPFPQPLPPVIPPEDLHPCPDKQDANMMLDGVLYDGESGRPVIDFVQNIEYY